MPRYGRGQFILDRAFDGGLPLSELMFGSYPDVAYAHHSGRIWDNAPYFALVLKVHYGLDYSADGWRIGQPKPIANYPLTRVENLSHQQARFNVRWVGRGSVQAVRVDGVPIEDGLLRHTDGVHEVDITLG